MRPADRPHRIIDWIGLCVISIFLASAISSCEQTCYDGELNQNEENVDCGGKCVPCDTTNGTCTDGILNQGEEDVDCGGPCSACITDTVVTNPDFICTGNGSSSYFPLSVNSYWIYAMPNSQWFKLEITEQTQQNNGKTYFHMITTGAFGTFHDYYREENGQTYRWSTSLEAEEVFLPSNLVAGSLWNRVGMDSIVAASTTATLNSTNGCSYENLLKVISFSSDSIGTVNSSTEYYKKGIGRVQIVDIQANLDSVVIF